MKEGSVIRAAFTQADGKIKIRPAVILKHVPPYDDYLICAISSKLWNYVDGLDLIVDTSHSDFGKSGLIGPGIIRTGMTVTVPSGIIQGTIGELSSNTHFLLVKQLAEFLLRENEIKK